VTPAYCAASLLCTPSPTAGVKGGCVWGQWARENIKVRDLAARIVAQTARSASAQRQAGCHPPCQQAKKSPTLRLRRLRRALQLIGMAARRPDRGGAIGPGNGPGLERP
jgi:hypothetical protein